MKKMPEQDRAKILEQVEVFKVEKRKFDIEVSKWDDNGNDIIVLAKHMVRFFFKISIICSNRHFTSFGFATCSSDQTTNPESTQFAQSVSLRVKIYKDLSQFIFFNKKPICPPLKMNKLL